MKIEMNLEEFKKYASSVGIKVLNLSEEIVTVEMSINELLAEEKSVVQQEIVQSFPNSLNIRQFTYCGLTYTFDFDDSSTGFTLRDALLQGHKIDVIRWIKAKTLLGLGDVKAFVDIYWDTMVSFCRGGR